MRKLWWIVALAIVVPILAMSQGRIHRLAVSGYPGAVPVTQLNGKNYVELAALAQLVNGSLSFHGDQITLSLTGNPPAAATEAKTGLSRDFLLAGIEEMSTIREWHSALATAVQNQYPVVPDLLRPYETAATKNLHITQVAATTEDDQKAAQMIANAFQKMKQLSDSYLAKRAAATYINADSLTNDTLNLSLIACGHSLQAMAASKQYTDDGACR